MFGRWRLGRRCRELAAKCTDPSLAAYILACGALRIDRLDNTPLISADLELTGLDARLNQIVAMGWTKIEHGRILLGSNHYTVVKARQSVGHSAAIHELTDAEVARGAALEAALQSLFEAATGRVWIFHHADLDVAFLRQACLAWAGVSPPFWTLDTLHMELLIRKRRNLPVRHGDLRLGKLRAAYNLPPYLAHNALADACATAELILAIAADIDFSGPLKLRPHVRCR